MMHGKGTFTNNKNGRVYIGEMLNSKRHGQGTDTWTTGKEYTGDFANDKREG